MCIKRYNNQFLIVLLLCFLFFSCIDSTKKQYGLSKARVLVLCDVSNSTTYLQEDSSPAGRLNQLKEYVSCIPRWYELGSEISFFPVTDNTVSAQLGPTVSYNIVNNSDIQPQKKKVTDEVARIQLLLDSCATMVKNSCISTSVKRCLERIEELGSQQAGINNELIIISDLVEACRISDSATIDFNTSKKQQFRKSLMLFEKKAPAMNVSGLKLDVKVILNSPGMDENLHLIRDAWKKWFLRIGISEEHIHFYTEKPPFPDNALLDKM